MGDLSSEGIIGHIFRDRALNRLNSSSFTIIKPTDLVDISVVGIEASNSPSDAVTDTGAMRRRKE